MTDAEKKQMLQFVRIAEFLFSQTLALKSVLLAHHIPEDAWEKEYVRLTSDLESSLAREKFQRMYDSVKQAPDEKAEIQALLQARPESKKPLN
jgi:hypothetical protein